MQSIQKLLEKSNSNDCAEPGRAEARTMIAKIHKIGGRQVGREVELVDRFDAAELIEQIGRSGPASAESRFEHISGLLGVALKEVWRRCELRQHLEAECGPIGDDEFLGQAERTGILL